MTVRHFGNGTLGSNDFTAANTAFALSQDVADSNLANNDLNNGTPTNAFMTARTDVAVTQDRHAGSRCRRARS